jgi:hypothetical protein
MPSLVRKIDRFKDTLADCRRHVLRRAPQQHRKAESFEMGQQVIPANGLADRLRHPGQDVVYRLSGRRQRLVGSCREVDREQNARSLGLLGGKHELKPFPAQAASQWIEIVGGYRNGRARDLSAPLHALATQPTEPGPDHGTLA